MARREFNRATRQEALRRSGQLCEAVGVRYGLPKGQRCNCPLSKGVEFHHELEAALGGDNSLENCLAVCIACHRFVTRIGTRTIRKADRVKAKFEGTYPKTRHPLKGRGFQKREEQSA